MSHGFTPTLAWFGCQAEKGKRALSVHVLQPRSVSQLADIASHTSHFDLLNTLLHSKKDAAVDNDPQEHNSGSGTHPSLLLKRGGASKRASEQASWWRNRDRGGWERLTLVHMPLAKEAFKGNAWRFA
ncbi:uncharacterized protein UDID_19354 [Ustilago sp. UG-2017a]|nr:uncharacterized protein UDID_19354 [Ustilago sp. UG-2017a]